MDACKKQHIFYEGEQLLALLVLPAVIVVIAIIKYTISLIIFADAGGTSFFV